MDTEIRINAKRVKDGGVQICRTAGVFGRVMSDRVRRAIDLAAANARTGKGDRIARGEAIASGGFVDFRGAAELGEPNDQPVV